MTELSIGVGFPIKDRQFPTIEKQYILSGEECLSRKIFEKLKQDGFIEFIDKNTDGIIKITDVIVMTMDEYNKLIQEER